MTSILGTHPGTAKAGSTAESTGHCQRVLGSTPKGFGILAVLLASLVQAAEPPRFERSSEPIETPHVAWAKPLPGGPLRVLCLVGVISQRDVIELAQRLDMQFDLVTFQEPLLHDDVARKFDKLLAEKTYDLILLSKAPLPRLPKNTQVLLAEKVHQGAGVLNVNSMVTLPTSAAIRGQESGAFLEIGLPLDLLPSGCRPEVKVGRYGQGRTVQLAYSGRLGCLTPLVRFEQVDYRDWETYYQLVCRAALWAAKRQDTAMVESLWPGPAVRETVDAWQTEQTIVTSRPRLVRATDAWQVESSEEKLPLPTWRGFGAAATVKNGKMHITECHVSGTGGFVAAALHFDFQKTPLLEVNVEQARQWSLFVADARLERTLGTLQAATAEKGVKRYDLRTLQKLSETKTPVFCFATHGARSSLVLGSIRFLTAEGQPLPPASESAATTTATEVILRLRAPNDGPAKATATYRGLDYYIPMTTRQATVTLKKNVPVEVRFPLLERGGGRHQAVDLVVRDDQGRSLATATAAYDVVAPVTLTSWAPQEEFARRGDKVRLVAKFDNQGMPRQVRLTARLSDMYSRRIANEEAVVTLAAGQSEQAIELPTDRSLTTLNRARLWVTDAQGVLAAADADVYLPQVNPPWEDYLVSTSQFGQTNAYLRPYAIRLAQGWGIEGLVVPFSHAMESLREAAPLMFWGAADVRAFGYNFHGEETSTARKPCLSDPVLRDKISASYEKLGAALRRYGPMAQASLEDESELSGARYCNLEVCTSEHCMRRYHQWLVQQHRSIESLNRAWDTSYASFDEVKTITHDVARQMANPSPWVDWRTFMEEVWLDGLLLTRKGVKSRYPEVRMGFSNTFGQMPFSGWNYRTASRHEDMSIEYPTVIFQLHPPKTGDAFEEDSVPMNVAVRQKMDIRRSFLPDEAPTPGWLWYDRSEQGAQVKPWWMAFLGAKGCTPWGPDSLGVQPGAKSMAFWAFVHPQLAHTMGSTWLADSIHDLTHGVGKIFVDYQRQRPSVAVLYSQPSLHLAWAWSDAKSAFDPPTNCLYAWYYKSRVNVTRMLRELGLGYRYVDSQQIAEGGLKDYRVLLLPCSLCLSEEAIREIDRFVQSGGAVVADVGAGAADEHGKPIPHRASIEKLFGISRESVGRKIEPGPLTPNNVKELFLPRPLRLAGQDAITARAPAWASHADKTPAIVIQRQGNGRAVYLNGLLGYSMPSRQFLRELLAGCGVSTPIRVTSGGQERMGYECTTFRRGPIEVLGVLRLGSQQSPTDVTLGRSAHLYDVRAKRYLGQASTAQFDLTQKAAAVLAVLPYQVTGLEAKASPAEVAPGHPVTVALELRASSGPGDHVVRVEVDDPAGRHSRAYTRNVLTVAGRHQYTLTTALDEQPGRWRIVATDVISGQTARTEFTVSPSR